MDERIGLVFSWDPRARAWIKERGPENAAQPPAAPRDSGAVQTYFLEPETGRWLPTILGLRGRQIAEELGKFYRGPYETGLDLVETNTGRQAAAAPGRRSGVPFALAALVVVLIAGGVASQTLLAPATDADASTVAPSTAPTSAATQRTTTGSAAPSVAVSSPAVTSTPPTASLPAAGITSPARTPAPTPVPQPTTVILSTTLPDGMRLFYSGPNIASQGALLKATVNAIYANGEPYIYQIDVRVGSGAWTPMTTSRNGSYTATLPVSAPKGSQPVSVNVHFGPATTVYTLGSMIVE